MRIYAIGSAPEHVNETFLLSAFCLSSDHFKFNDALKHLTLIYCQMPLYCAHMLQCSANSKSDTWKETIFLYFYSSSFKLASDCFHLFWKYLKYITYGWQIWYKCLHRVRPEWVALSLSNVWEAVVSLLIHTITGDHKPWILNNLVYSFLMTKRHNYLVYNFKQSSFSKSQMSAHTPRQKH